MIELGKKYQTRDGRAVRILCVDMKSFHSHVVGLVTGKDGNESPSYWDSDGTDLVFQNNGRDDLIPVPTKHEGWGVIRDDMEYAFNVFLTKSAAEQFITEGEGRIKQRVVHVTWES